MNNTLYFSLNGSIKNQTVYTVINGTFDLSSNSVYSTINGGFEIEEVILSNNFAQQFISNISVGTLDLYDKIDITSNINNTIVNGEITLISVINPSSNITYVSNNKANIYIDGNISMYNVNRNYLLLFSDVSSNLNYNFTGISDSYLTHKQIYLKVFRIDDDVIYPTQYFEPIVIKIEGQDININIKELIAYRYIDGSNIKTGEYFTLKRDLALGSPTYLDFFGLITQASTYVMKYQYGFLINIDINMDLLIHREEDNGPDTFYKMPVYMNFYNVMDEYRYGQNTMDYSDVNVYLSINSDKFQGILGGSITSSGSAGPLEQGLLGNGAMGSENGSIHGTQNSNTNLGLRFLEIAAIHLFGHAKAQAAIKNDTEFQLITNKIKDEIVSSMPSKGFNMFKQYIGAGKFEEADDIDAMINFNFSDIVFRYTVNYTIQNIYDGSDNKISDNSYFHQLQEWTTNITLDLIHTP